jgi:septal ring factor EnvC (AmiA/AmiB activator)
MALRALAIRRLAAISALAVIGTTLSAGPSRGDLAGRYATGQQRAGQLQSQIQSDGEKIQGYQGTIAELRGRLSAIERSLAIQEQLLHRVRFQLATARERQRQLEAQYARDRQVLAAQLVADYELPPPTIVDVVVGANGFTDLLNRVNDLRSIARTNAQAIQLVNTIRIAVSAQARQLARVEARRARATAAVLVERDQVAQLHLSIVNREIAAESDRRQKNAQLGSLQKTLAGEAAALQRQAAAAQAASAATAAPAASGCVNTPFVPHGGEFGFFPAPGTDYSVGEEPVIAARLDALGKALQLALIGISGYRTPQHSVEVGGFADDPHTRGEASDTPGVEGVPESTLEQFCLTRPFPGPREADHIQEL